MKVNALNRELVFIAAGTRGGFWLKAVRRFIFIFSGIGWATRVAHAIGLLEATACEGT